jgi:hypothetical protein
VKVDPALEAERAHLFPDRRGIASIGLLSSHDVELERAPPESVKRLQ